MVLNLILIGLAITLEPIPLTAFILILASKNGVKKGAGFIFGWLLSLAVVVALTLLVTGNNPPKPSTAPSLAALAVKILIGLVLIFIAARRWKGRGRPKKEKKPPKWQAGIDDMSPWFAIAIAPLVQPWGLVGAGVAEITEAKLTSWQSSLALFGFCVLATITYLALEIYAGFWSEQTQVLLTKIRTWISTHTDQVIIVVSAALGFWLVGQSIYLIAT
jgi:threonine/homoserine/homoserine lactone efflux protein